MGIELERADIADLKTAIADTDESDVKTVLSGLLVGSRHHLAAYTAAASGQLPAPGTGMGPGRWDRQDPDAVAPGNGMGPGNGIGPGNGMGNRTDGDAGPGGWGHHGGDCPWG